MFRRPERIGRYKVIEELGRGSMGAFFLAADSRSGLGVVLKVLNPCDKVTKQRFLQEAELIARLHHRNIVAVLDRGCDPRGTAYVVFELLQGRSLDHLIQTQPMSLRWRLDLVAQASRGLAHAHRKGFVHRDVKPANLFVNADGLVKLLDFGVVDWDESLHQPGWILGTPGYMSPEQVQGRRLDGRSDVFALGVILYQLLTKTMPFPGKDVQTILFKTLNQCPPSLVAPTGSDVSGLQGILNRALAKEVEDRYEGADDLAGALVTSFLQSTVTQLPDDIVFETVSA